MAYYQDNDKTRLSKKKSSKPESDVKQDKQPWMSQKEPPQPPGGDEPPDWMSQGQPPQPPGGDEPPDWMSQGQPPQPPGGDEPPDWMKQDGAQPPSPPQNAGTQGVPSQDPPFYQQQQDQGFDSPAEAPLPNEPELLFVVESVDGTMEFQLYTGRPVRVGRANNQDIVISDQTLSREHLLLTRQDNRVSIQITGQNGLTHNGVTLKSQTITLSVPANFMIGNVSCRLKKTIDDDATILIDTPKTQSRQDWQPQQPSRPDFSQPDPGSAAEPFSAPAAKGGDSPPFSQDFQQEQRPFASTPVEQSFDPFGPGGESGTDPDFDQIGLGSEPFGGDADWGEGGVAEPFYKKSGKGLWIGLAVVLVLAVAAVVYFFYIKPAGKVEKPVVVTEKPTAQINETKTQSTPAVEPAASETLPVQANDLYGKYYNSAYEQYKKGNLTVACFYLKKIPLYSVLRSQAEQLAKEMGNCDL